MWKWGGTLSCARNLHILLLEKIQRLIKFDWYYLGWLAQRHLESVRGHLSKDLFKAQWSPRSEWEKEWLIRESLEAYVNMWSFLSSSTAKPMAEGWLWRHMTFSISIPPNSQGTCRVRDSGACWPTSPPSASYCWDVAPSDSSDFQMSIHTQRWPWARERGSLCRPLPGHTWRCSCRCSSPSRARGRTWWRH